jgi:type II secretory pathway pseudopilin PulG
LVEILVVIVVFALLTIIATQSILLTLTGARKTESTVRVRETLEYAVSTVERRIRNAKSITTCNSSSVQYVDQLGVSSRFSCNSIGSGGYLASDSLRVTNSEINLTACTFICRLGVTGVPPSVEMLFTGELYGATGTERSSVTINTRVYTRAY